jgi:hypothetical protein
MKLRAKELTNVVLLLVALGTGVAVYLSRSAPSTDEQEARTNNLIKTWREDEVSRIEIFEANQTLTLERAKASDAGDSTWNILAPVKEEADPEAVERLLAAIGVSTPVRDVPEPDRKRLGLDPARRHMKLQMGALKFTLSLGNEAPTPAGSVYAEISGDAQASRVVILKSDLSGVLHPDANAFRSKSFVNVGRERVRTLSIASQAGSLEMAQEKRRFRVTAGPNKGIRVSRDMLDAAFLQLGRVRAEPFLTLDVAQQNLNSANSVELTLGTDPPITLSVGGTCPVDATRSIALRRTPKPAAGCVPKDIVNAFSQSPTVWLDQKVFSLHTDEVEELTLESGSEKLRLVRKGGAFTLLAPSEAQVELPLGNRRISELLRDAELVKDRDLKKLGLDPPRGKASVRSSAADEASVIQESVLIGNPVGRDVYLFREHDAAVLKIDSERARAFQPDSTLLRSTKIWNFGLSNVSRVAVKTLQFSQVLSRDSTGHLKLLEPKGFEHDGSLSVQLLQTLGALTTERWVTDHDDGTFVFEKPRVSVELEMVNDDAGAKTHQLVVGNLTSGGAFAKVDQDAAVFVLGSEQLALLESLIVDRSAFVVNPEDVKSIVVEVPRDKRSTTLVRQGEGFAEKNGKLHTSNVARIVDALSTLRAEAAVALGAPTPETGLSDPTLVIQVMPTTGTLKSRVFRIGSADVVANLKVYYARAEGVNATFVLSKTKVDEIKNAL